MSKYNMTEKKDKDAVYKTFINPKVLDELKEKIQDIIFRQKKYKDKDYSARKLAEDLRTNTRYVSAVMNVCFRTNYTSFVNQYRVEKAMKLLADRKYMKHSMEDVSDMVGFANRQSFYSAFFKVNECSPRDYRTRYFELHPISPEEVEEGEHEADSKK